MKCLHGGEGVGVHNHATRDGTLQMDVPGGLGS